MASIKFGTDGWRAVMAREFTFDNVALVAQAIADYMIEAGIASRGLMVGYDARFLSEDFAQLVADVATASGIRTLVPDRDTPTPVTAYTVRDQNLGGAVMISASHNPPIYNGIKFIPEYCHPALPDVTNAIEKHIARLQDNPQMVNREGNPGLQVSYDPKPAYFSHLKTILDIDMISKAGLQLWYDPLYASGREYLDEFLRDIGVDVKVIKGERNPLFGGSLPDPNAYNLRELSAKVVESGAQLGLSTDGDADRFGIVDRDGVYLSANETIVLALWHLLKTRKPEGKAVVRSVVTTHQVDAIAKAYGYEVIETPVGFKYVGQAVLQNDAILGGEESGGLTIFGHIPEKDGIVADLVVVEAVAKTGLSCRQMLNEIAEIYGAYYTKRIDLQVQDEAKSILLEKLKNDPPKYLGREIVSEVKTVDGVQLIRPDGAWTCVRPSGTEPIVRCYAEARSETDLQEILNVITQIIQEVDPTAHTQQH
ncbi:MAG: phosphoglucomutase/phosphomannomutase family protein [bacterium]